MEDLQVKVIASTRTPALLPTLRRLFPGSSVTVQPAVFLTGVETKSLVSSNIIGHTAAHSLTHGRRWHHEIATKGAVGLAHAVRLALLDDPARNLLMFEEDCIIRDEAVFMDYVGALCANASMFDIAAMGTLHKQQSADEAVDTIPGWIHLRDMFWGLHCVFYSAGARERLADVLGDRLEMQIDSLYGSMAKNGLLRVWGQHGGACVYQKGHTSLVQGSKGIPVVVDSTAVIAGVLVTGLLVALLVLRASRRPDKAGT